MGNNWCQRSRLLPWPHTRQKHRLAAGKLFGFDYDFALGNLRFCTFCTLKTTTDIKADTHFPHNAFFPHNKPSQKRRTFKDSSILLVVHVKMTKSLSANLLLDSKSSPPFYHNNRVVMLRMRKCFLLKYKLKNSFNTAKLKCSTLSHKHTPGHRAEKWRERFHVGERWISCVPCCWNLSSVCACEWGKVREQYFIWILLHNKADEKDHKTKSSCHGNLTDQKCHMLTGWNGAFVAQPSDCGTWLLCNFAKELLRAWNHCI